MHLAVDAACQAGDIQCFVLCGHDQRSHDIRNLMCALWPEHVCHAATCCPNAGQCPVSSLAQKRLNQYRYYGCTVSSSLWSLFNADTAVFISAYFCNLNWLWWHVVQAYSKSWHHILEQPICMWKSHHPGLPVLGQAEIIIMKWSQISHFVGLPHWHAHEGWDLCTGLLLYYTTWVGRVKMIERARQLLYIRVLFDWDVFEYCLRDSSTSWEEVCKCNGL